MIFLGTLSCVAQKISPLEGAKYEIDHHTSAPPFHTLFMLHQHNVPQKITFSVKIYDCEKKKKSKVKNLKKLNFTVFILVT